MHSSWLWPKPTGTFTEETWPGDHLWPFSGADLDATTVSWVGEKGDTQRVVLCAWPLWLASEPANSTGPIVITKAPSKAELTTLPYQGNLWASAICQYLLEKHQMKKICCAPEKNAHSASADKRIQQRSASLQSVFSLLCPKSSF